MVVFFPWNQFHEFFVIFVLSWELFLRRSYVSPKFCTVRVDARVSIIFFWSDFVRIQKQKKCLNCSNMQKITYKDIWWYKHAWCFTISFLFVTKKKIATLKLPFFSRCMLWKKTYIKWFRKYYVNSTRSPPKKTQLCFFKEIFYHTTPKHTCLSRPQNIGQLTFSLKMLLLYTKTFVFEQENIISMHCAS